jgi:hypothetical protein
MATDISFSQKFNDRFVDSLGEMFDWKSCVHDIDNLGFIVFEDCVIKQRFVLGGFVFVIGESVPQISIQVGFTFETKEGKELGSSL